MRELKLIVFDCDGVLFDSREANRRYYNSLRERFGHPPMDEEELEYVHTHNAQLSTRHIFRDYPGEEEEAEAWGEARNTYGDVLKIDRAIQFAVQGFARMETRLRLEGQAQAYLGRPDALESDRNLEKANRLLVDMKTLDPKGPKWLSQIQTLDRLIEEARRKIRVVLLSDGQTDVAVYKIGIFGRFQQKDLSLRPGTYTVVGFRDGYKDVRAIVRIKPEDTEIQVRIVCVERI